MKKLCYVFVLTILGIPAIAFSQQWTQKASVPIGTDAAVTFTLHTKIYLVGGSGSKHVYQYDPALDRWTAKNNFPGDTSRAFAVSFVLNGKAYVGLGKDGEDQGTRLRNDLWVYDDLLDRWTKAADFPGAPRDGAGAFVVNGRAYVGGGADAQFGVLGDFYEYDPSLNVWTRKADVPTGTPPNIIFPACFSIGSKGYMATGGVGNGQVPDLYEYDPVADTWTKKASLPAGAAARQAAVGFAINDTGYVGLGMADYTNSFKDFYAYTQATDSWRALTPTFPGTPRAWSTAIAFNGKAYVGTGFDFQSFFSGWWEFDPNAKVSQQPGSIALDPSPGYNFGSVDTNHTSDFTFHITNPSTKSVVIDSIRLSGQNASAFSIINSPQATPYTIAPGAMKNYTIRFTAGPTAMADPEVAMLRIWFDGVRDSLVQSILSAMVINQQASVKNISSSAFNLDVSPNPFQSSTTVRINSSGLTGPAHIQLLDMLGRQVYNTETTTNKIAEQSIRLYAEKLNLSAGVYYLIASMGGKSISQQIVCLK